MKNNTLLLLFLLILSGQSLFSQKTLTPSVRPYTANWSSTLVDAMHRAGFDMPTKPASVQPKGIRQRSELQLDSTKTYHEFNLNAVGDSTPLSRTNYTYVSANTKIETDFYFENGAWQPLSRSTVTSDALDRLVDIVSEAYDPEAQAFHLDSRLEIFPHGNSEELVDSFFVSAWDTTIMDWVLILAEHYTFDAEDRILETTSTFDLQGVPLLFKEVYSYDANGDNHLIEEFGIVGEESFPTSRTDLVYAEHKLIEETASITDGVSFFPQTRNNYAYMLFGAIRREMNFQWNEANANWQLGRTVDYKYNPAQQMIEKQTTIIEPGQWDKKDLVYFVYVDDENLYAEWFLTWNDDLFDWILDSRKHYYYNGVTAVDPGPVASQQLAAWPNPSTGVVQINLEAAATVRVFDAAGQLLQSRQVQPGQAIDLTTLPAGIYTLSAQQGADLYHKKIVKQ
ncbi:MAG: T9SS type A sorting domain-containing protein [Lewinellaceae bacterium]|nr:T9SS type A sorting domain-containing protein [Lewinellaceae bacterium]